MVLRPVVQGRDGGFWIYTTRPDTLFGATYCVLAPEHPLVRELTTPDRRGEVDAYAQASKNRAERDRLAHQKDKTGVFTGAYAINPVNAQPGPIWVADYVLNAYFHDDESLLGKHLLEKVYKQVRAEGEEQSAPNAAREPFRRVEPNANERQPIGSPSSCPARFRVADVARSVPDEPLPS